MADEYDFAITEEEFKALIDELLGKVPDEKTQQADARQALSEIIGIDLEKVAALIKDDAAEQTNEKTEDPQTQEEPNSVLAEDLFTAQDPNGLQSTYKAVDLPFGTVITIEGDEFLHTLIDHGDNGHSAWVNTMAELLDDNAVAELARSANGNVTIIHFG